MHAERGGCEEPQAARRLHWSTGPPRLEDLGRLRASVLFPIVGPGASAPVLDASIPRPGFSSSGRSPCIQSHFLFFVGPWGQHRVPRSEDAIALSIAKLMFLTVAAHDALNYNSHRRLKGRAMSSFTELSEPGRNVSGPVGSRSHAPGQQLKRSKPCSRLGTFAADFEIQNMEQ